jgi:catechol 2,3-dioxygenase-like lactoylglutathione lyase family enzyme
MRDERFGGGFAVRALGEVAIRCRDVDAMARFYGEVLGLQRLADRGGIVFFRIAEGFGGHTAVLALFPGEGAVAGDRSSLHHLALTVTPHDQARAADWFRRVGLSCRYEDFSWIGWRGLFTTDPEGNTVELVAATGRGPEVTA